jgi:ABC-type lipoprotein release transport system permease subunit
VDPVSFGVTAGVLAAVAMAATLIPARRASKIAPAEALRGQ